MTRSSRAAILVVVMMAGSLALGSVRGDAPDLSGRWSLDRSASQFPSEVGFAAEWLSAGRSGGESSGGGRRGSGGGGGATGAFVMPRVSEDDAKRVQELTAEVRNPAARLTIVDTPAAVTITDDRGRSRTFHPDGKEEILRLDDVPVGVISKRDAGRLTVTYKVEQGREVRYTYARAASAQLTVDVQFIEHGAGDTVRRIYTAASATDAPDATPVTQSGAAPPRSEGQPAASPQGQGRTSVPGSAAGLPTETFNQQPDAELKGLTRLGVVVEGLTAQAAGCGLSQDAIETALSGRLSSAGFKVIRDSDEDSYLYVNVMTTSLPSGLCVSRYDVTIYTHTTARLSYQETPVLVQVSLLHKGGIAGGASATHGASVLRGVQEYLDQFVTRIHDANK